MPWKTLSKDMYALMKSDGETPWTRASCTILFSSPEQVRDFCEKSPHIAENLQTSSLIHLHSAEVLVDYLDRCKRNGLRFVAIDPEITASDRKGFNAKVLDINEVEKAARDWRDGRIHPCWN